MKLSSTTLIESNDPVGFLSMEDEDFPYAVGPAELYFELGTTELARQMDKRARAISACLHTFEIPIAGGSAIVSSDQLNDLKEFLTQDDVMDHLNGKSYPRFLPFAGLNLTADQLNQMLEAVGDEEITGAVNSINIETLLAKVAAQTAISVSRELLKFRVSKGIDPLYDHSFAFDGFDTTSVEILKQLQDTGRVHAIANENGCIIAEDPDDEIVEQSSFVIDPILDLYKQYSDDFIYHCGLEVYPSEKIYETGVDVLVRGEKVDLLTETDSMGIIRSGVGYVVPLGYQSYTDVALEKLLQSSVTIFPENISAAGNLLGRFLNIVLKDQNEICNFIENAVSHEARELIMAIKACGDTRKSMYQLAEERVEQNRMRLVEMNDSQQDLQELAENLVKRYQPAILQ